MSAMLTLDLVRLEKEGTLEIEAAIPVDSDLWTESGLTPAAPLGVRLRAHAAGSGEIVATGRLKGRLKYECRRCLKTVEREVDQEVVFVFSDEAGPDGKSGEIRPIPEGVDVIALGDSVREEMLLETDRFVECDPECRGLCPGCGVNRNDETCDCTSNEPDPRWDALRALKSE